MGCASRLSCEAAQGEFRRRLVDPITGGLAPNPFDEVADTVFELHARLESEQFARERRVRETMPDVPGSVAAWVLGIDLLAQAVRSKSAISFTDTARPVPRLIEAPTAASERNAQTIPSTMSLTWMKSRDCFPSSKMRGGLSFKSRDEKIAATPVYGFDSACPGP